MFGEVSMSPDRLCERGNAAIGNVDLGANAVDDDVGGEKRSEKALHRPA